jgi:hypothetical protein
MTPKAKEPPPKSADDQVRSVERHADKDRSTPGPVRDRPDGQPEVPDDSQEKQKASPRADPARRGQILPG